MKLFLANALLTCLYAGLHRLHRLIAWVESRPLFERAAVEAEAWHARGWTHAKLRIPPRSNHPSYRRGYRQAVQRSGIGKFLKKY